MEKREGGRRGGGGGCVVLEGDRDGKVWGEGAVLGVEGRGIVVVVGWGTGGLDGLECSEGNGCFGFCRVCS